MSSRATHSQGRISPVAGGRAGIHLQRSCACGQHTTGGNDCSSCAKKKGSLQRSPLGPQTPSQAPPIVHDVLNSPGQPLDTSTRAFMEPRFGHDFSGVRVHTGPRADESARAVNAAAYTVGEDIVFKSPMFRPTDPVGRRTGPHPNQSGQAHDHGFDERASGASGLASGLNNRCALRALVSQRLGTRK